MRERTSQRRAHSPFYPRTSPRQRSYSVPFEHMPDEYDPYESDNAVAEG